MRYTQIGQASIHPIHRLSCHCGGVVIELHLPNGVENPRRCNCSICRRRGAICSSVPLADLKILQGQALLTLYQFNTRTAKHYFCKVCGIYTHHQRRSDPGVYAYNVGCLEGVNPFELGEVPISDGVHHVSDRL
ncbi:GFA family protein [Chitinivorax tropicus]|nr:GFA family protein [Chitinivorax tropicus]